jgi:hypothetical protein
LLTSYLSGGTYRWRELLLTINGLSSRAISRRVFAIASEGEAEDIFLYYYNIICLWSRVGEPSSV